MKEHITSIGKIRVACSGIEEAGGCTIEISSLEPTRTIRIEIPKLDLCIKKSEADNILEEKIIELLSGRVSTPMEDYFRALKKATER